MAIDLTQLDLDMQGMVNDLPDTIVWDGGNYACVAGNDDDQKDQNMVGYFPERNVIIHVRTALFGGSRPLPQETITLRGNTYRLTKVTTAEDDVTLILEASQEQA